MTMGCDSAFPYYDTCAPLLAHQQIYQQSRRFAGDIEESIKSGGLAAIKTERIRVSMQVLDPA